MIKSVMRSIIVMAARTPSIVMRKIQKWHSSVPGVQKRFKSAVNAIMNSTGFNPLKSAFAPTREMRTATISVRMRRP